MRRQAKGSKFRQPASCLEGASTMSKMEDLREALRQGSGSVDQPSCLAEIAGSLQGLAVLDAPGVLENLEYDLDIYWEMVEMYLTRYAGVGDRLVGKLQADDLDDTFRCAHDLKGIASNIGGRQLAEVACQIQDMCLDGIKPDCRVWGPLVKTHTASFKDELERLDWGALELFAAGNS
jgi:HPt (histidine-containing phosphotransfer) domain-containing protein